MEPHPSLGAVYRPYSVLKTYYPDNPRGYFKEEDIRERKWQFNVNTGNNATLVFPPEKPKVLRIAIKEGDNANPVGYSTESSTYVSPEG